MSPDEDRWFEQPGRYRILMDGRWELTDLAELPHAFEQCYSFIYCFDTEVGPLTPEWVAYVLHGYPWRGGFSYINFYSVLRNQVIWRDRPRVNAIKYASPGWMELVLNPDVAIQVAKAVAAIAASSAAAAKSYAIASKALRGIKVEREKAKLANLKLTADQDAAIMQLCEQHAKFLGFKSVRSLNEQTGNSEVTLRLLLAHHRRLRILAKFDEDGKAALPEEYDQES